MESNEYTYIKTIKELKQNIGKIVVAFYYITKNRGKWNLDETKENVYLMWMFKLLDDDYSTKFKDEDLIKQKQLLGINHICLVNNSEFHFPSAITSVTPFLMHSIGMLDVKIPRYSSAQDYLRLATKEELKIYNQLTRKRRILGHD